MAEENDLSAGEDSDIEGSALDGLLRLRIDSAELDIFKNKSVSVTGKPYQILVREIVTAFIQGRLRIVATEEQKRQLGNLYE